MASIDLSLRRSPTRFVASSNSAKKMWAVVTRSNGGYEQLDYCQVAKPSLRAGDVLIKVLAAGVNNTEINTRLGWYSSRVTGSTDEFAQTSSDFAGDDGGWNEQTPFPLIQGTDCCGEVVAVFDTDHAVLVGQRVLVRACMRSADFSSLDNVWMASDFDGAFAQYVAVPASEVFRVQSAWSDAELATLPCAYGTAENMLHRAHVTAADRVMVMGASGGVGSAAVQLAKRRGAQVVAITSASKAEAIQNLGADQVLDRNTDLLATLGEYSVSVLVDNVGGSGFKERIKLLQRGGRLVTSGAIAGALVELDMRDLYLRDLQFFGCTAWDEPVFPNLIGYVERGEIKPLLAGTFALQDIAIAQKRFLQKDHIGNFVLIPPAVS